jgi:hypothetical protein
MNGREANYGVKVYKGAIQHECLKTSPLQNPCGTKCNGLRKATSCCRRRYRYEARLNKKIIKNKSKPNNSVGLWFNSWINLNEIKKCLIKGRGGWVRKQS